jgi:putative mannosyltransferase
MTLTDANAAIELDKAAQVLDPRPEFSGRGIVIAAGGPYLPSAYLTVRLLRHFGCRLPIEIWHAGRKETTPWVNEAFDPWRVTFHDVMHHCPDRALEQMRGWPIKSAALVYTGLRETLFIDADCFPLRNLEFLFETAEFKNYRAVFWPDHKHHRLVENSQIWKLTGLNYRGDTELETGLIVLDKSDCWQQLCLTEWMNARSDFWYQHTIGDKDTFYLAWRKLDRPYFLAPACQRLRLFATRHFWADEPVAEHRTGASKYGLPRKLGPFRRYLIPHKWRSTTRNLVDELFQRIVINNFGLHAAWLIELKQISEHS